MKTRKYRIESGVLMNLRGLKKILYPFYNNKKTRANHRSSPGVNWLAGCQHLNGYGRRFRVRWHKAWGTQPTHFAMINKERKESSTGTLMQDFELYRNEWWLCLPCLFSRSTFLNRKCKDYYNIKYLCKYILFWNVY